MSKFRITDGKGFGITFDNGWSVSVQWGYGNYCDNYSAPEQSFGEDYSAKNRRLGRDGSNTAECAVFDPAGETVNLPAFMFDGDVEYANVVSNRSTPEQVLKLMNWVAEQS